MPISDGRFGLAADGIDPAAPDHGLGHQQHERGDRRHDEEASSECRSVDAPPSSGDRVGHAAHRRVADRQLERETAADAERGERDDEGMRQASEHVDEAVDGADRAPRERASPGSPAARNRSTRNTSPPMTVASARLAPTERSMPRVRMTRCWPIATMAMTAVWARMLPILPGFRKFGVSRLITRDERDEDEQRADAEEPQPKRHRGRRRGRAVGSRAAAAMLIVR